MTTITDEQREQIRLTLARMEHLPVGVGSKEAACSVAAINLALTGRLTDEARVACLCGDCSAALVAGDLKTFCSRWRKERIVRRTEAKP